MGGRSTLPLQELWSLGIHIFPLPRWNQENNISYIRHEEQNRWRWFKNLLVRTDAGGRILSETWSTGVILFLLMCRGPTIAIPKTKYWECRGKGGVQDSPTARGQNSRPFRSDRRKATSFCVGRANLVAQGARSQCHHESYRKEPLFQVW